MSTIPLPSYPPADTRRHALLAGPVVPVMLRLALPTVAVLFVQTLVSVAETYFVSFLGTDTLAGVALVFPALLLMTTMSNGGLGGGVSSAVARALGAGRPADADRLVLHALVLAIGCGLIFSLGALWGGPLLRCVTVLLPGPVVLAVVGVAHTIVIHDEVTCTRQAACAHLHHQRAMPNARV